MIVVNDVISQASIDRILH